VQLPHKICIKRILYEYFAELEAVITANTDKDSCCSRCNFDLLLNTPERTIYNQKKVTLDARKNYILERL
jgi:hypothetical protein